MPAGGFKTFVSGEILSSANTNDFLMQGVLVFADATARDAAITSPVQGQLAFLKSTDAVTFYNGTAWVDAAFANQKAVVESVTGDPVITTDGTATVYSFNNNGSITFFSRGFVDVLVVGGGGGGGGAATDAAGGGGGAGGFLPATNYFVEAGTFAVTVGAGGVGGPVNEIGGNGGPSIFADLIAGGGGFGNGRAGTNGFFEAGDGASGGGGSGTSNSNSSGQGFSFINTQGHAGAGGNSSGTAANRVGGGGGGALNNGFGSTGTGRGGNGGDGKTSSITGTSLFYAGGGGGGTRNSTGPAGTGGSGVGGAGGVRLQGADASPANRGSGGGGGADNRIGGAGSAGVVIVRVG
jgi:hypothetical protein